MSNATASDPPVSSEIMLLVGPTLIGSLFGWLLFGISIVQLYLYNLSFPNERKTIQAVVYTIFILDIFQSVAVAINGWHTLVSGWGRPSELQFPGWTFSAVPSVSGIVAAWVQIFYAWRIHMLGRWRVIPCMIIIVALAQACAALAIGIGFAKLKDVSKLHEVNMYARTIVWLGGAAFTDVMISCSMLYLLYAAKQNSTRRTERVIRRLIRLTVETGMATATCAILELIFFLVFSTTNLHVLAAFVLCKVYSNALMTSLNSRSLPTGRGTSTTLSTTDPGWHISHSPPRTGFSSSGITTNPVFSTFSGGFSTNPTSTGGTGPAIVHIDTEVSTDVRSSVSGKEILGSPHDDLEMNMMVLVDSDHDRDDDKLRSRGIGGDV